MQAIVLSAREQAAVLAGLRLIQAIETENLSQDIMDIMTDGGTLNALAPDDIDELCTRINR